MVDVSGGSATGSVRERLLYIDNLRLMVISFVVMHHLAVTYSGFGSWYYIEGAPLDVLSTIWFAFYLSFQQGYFLGLLFLITGYFVAGSYDRKGFGRFVGERFRRLIIPTLIYMVAISPFIDYVELGNRGGGGFNVIDFLSGTGVMWFAVALFVFSLLYALVRLVVRRPSPADRKQLEPSLGKAVLLILIIAVSAFLIRIVQPIGTSVLNLQLCYFASYIALFLVGIVAYRNDLFARIGYRTGRRWLVGGIVLGFLAWLALVIVATATGTTAALNGELTWQSAAYSLWESFVAVAMSIGLVAVFREKFSRQSSLVRKLSDNSFAVYMFHPPILVAVALLFSSVALYPVVKWLALCVICVPLCFAATHFVFRRIPFLKNVLCPCSTFGPVVRPFRRTECGNRANNPVLLREKWIVSLVRRDRDRPPLPSKGGGILHVAGECTRSLSNQSRTRYVTTERMNASRRIASESGAT